MELAITDSTPVAEPFAETRQAPDKPKACETCSTPLNKDHIFCAWHGPAGPSRNQWLCDECVTGVRQQGLAMEVAVALTKQNMDNHATEVQLDVVEHAIKNLAEIQWIEAHDAAGSARSVDLKLSFRESRPIYYALRDALKQKLIDGKVNRKDLYNRLVAEGPPKD